MQQARKPEIDKEQRKSNAKINVNMRDPTTIAFNGDDFAPEPESPIGPDFTFPLRSERAIE